MTRLQRATFLRLTALCTLLGSYSGVVVAGPPIMGTLTTLDGIRVLKLWGNAYERGFAHGFLLGGDIMTLIESALLDPRTLKDPAQYETEICGKVIPQMKFLPEYEKEFEGMLAGVMASVAPEKIRLNRLDRNLSINDLKAVNTLADWNQFFCSSFSAWGDLEAQGELITGRNLDFFTLPGLTEQHVVIVYLNPGGGRKPWVSVAWPSLIGAYTAMNQDGVTINLHDVRVPPSVKPGPFTPRTLALREAIQTASAATAVDDVKKALSGAAAMCGNNIHVSAPFTGQAMPAAVFEWDADTTRDGGATLRVADTESRLTLRQAVMCTNHHRIRREAVSCDRYDGMQDRLTAWAQAGKKIDLESAQSILKYVSVPGTLQSVVFLPNRGEFFLGLADATRNGAEVKPVRFRLEYLFKR